MIGKNLQQMGLQLQQSVVGKFVGFCKIRVNFQYRKFGIYWIILRAERDTAGVGTGMEKVEEGNNTDHPPGLSLQEIHAGNERKSGNDAGSKGAEMHATHPYPNLFQILNMTKLCLLNSEVSYSLVPLPPRIAYAFKNKTSKNLPIHSDEQMKINS